VGCAATFVLFHVQFSIRHDSSEGEREERYMFKWSSPLGKMDLASVIYLLLQVLVQALVLLLVRCDLRPGR
jgi:hypothetical protein